MPLRVADSNLSEQALNKERKQKQNKKKVKQMLTYHFDYICSLQISVFSLQISVRFPYSPAPETKRLLAGHTLQNISL